jgi:uncharacterized protein YlxP (DUF503 family)
MEGDARIYIGVLRCELIVPGARSLKDRRQAVRSVVDRVRHRFELRLREIGRGNHPGRQTLAVSTVGNDAGEIRKVLERLRHYLQEQPGSWPGRVDVDVFSWHPPGADMSFDEEEPFDG